MREPEMTCEDGNPVPYSLAPVWRLQARAYGKWTKRVLHPEHEFVDLDFRQRYAAILLRERGF